jgi:hypothetical protein
MWKDSNTVKKDSDIPAAQLYTVKRLMKAYFLADSLQTS